MLKWDMVLKVQMVYHYDIAVVQEYRNVEIVGGYINGKFIIKEHMQAIS